MEVLHDMRPAGVPDLTPTAGLANPSLMNGQFLPFYFSSFQQMQQATDLFLQSGGDPRSTRDPTTQRLFAVMSNSFPTAPDRDWLRLFVQSLADENTRFYQGYWSDEMTARRSTRQVVDSCGSASFDRSFSVFSTTPSKGTESSFFRYPSMG